MWPARGRGIDAPRKRIVSKRLDRLIADDLYGAFSFYVGIDLPGRPAQKSTPRLGLNPGTDAAEIFSAVGTFLAGIAVFLSIAIVALDEPVRDGLALLVGCCWAIGSSLQIASGAIARNDRRW